ncbi:hypothetical protein SSCG_02591, partial [Streptomyces clavuligerus]
MYVKVNRRQVLLAGGAMGTAALLAACSGGTNSDVDSAARPGGGGRPRKGGTLRVGALGRAGAVTRDPHGTQANESDYLIIALVHDTLTAPGGGTSNTAPRLATRWEPSADLADLVAFTLRRRAPFLPTTAPPVNRPRNAVWVPWRKTGAKPPGGRPPWAPSGSKAGEISPAE